ncbi:DB module domain-containing protein [Ditylenchus destructor]|nr:DB module domain-containing protein [Ditylenchus destructor]
MSFTALLFVFTAGIVVVAGDWQSTKFHNCCINSTIPTPCADEACVYPPPEWPSPSTQACLDEYVNPYIACYADHQDNTQLCKDVGVFGMYDKCLIFCNGVDPHYAKTDTSYNICRQAVKYISHCNWVNVKPPVRNLDSRRWLGPLQNRTWEFGK